MTEEFKVSGMTCDGCKGAVERVVKRIPGVTRAEATVAEGKLVVEGTPDRAAVIQAVAKAGYPIA